MELHNSDFQLVYLRLRQPHCVPKLVHVPVLVQYWTVRQSLVRSPEFTRLLTADFDVGLDPMTSMRSALLNNSPAFPIDIELSGADNAKKRRVGCIIA